MLTKNIRPFVMIAMILTTALISPSTVKAQSNETSASEATLLVAQLSVPPTRNSVNYLGAEQEYLRQVAEQVKGLLYQELSAAERREMTGTAATIEVRYTGEGSFDVANVVSFSMNRLATTVHRKMVWKSLPHTGNRPLNQTTAKMKVGIDNSGEVQIKLELI